jgi:ribosomal protein S20
MTITNNQISSVIRTYMKSMKVRVGQTEKNCDDFMKEDEANISKEAVKKMIYNRIGERVTEKLKKYER